MAAGDNPRFVVTSLEAPTPQHVYEDLYCARGNCENDIKAVKNDLHSDRTSATTFLANATRLLWAWGLCPRIMRSAPTRSLTALATAQPSTVILTLFKVATQVKQHKDRFSCTCRPRALSALLHRVTTAHSHPVPAFNTS